MNPLLLDHQYVRRTYKGSGKLPAAPDIYHPEEWIASSTETFASSPSDGNGLSKVMPEGELLKDLIARHPVDMLGARRSEKGGGMGVLVKLIDAGERLTIQVHPDVQTARKLFDSPYGKTECWLFLDSDDVAADQHPCVYYGFKEGVTSRLWRDLFERQDIAAMLDCMHRIEISPGDVILVEGGVPHAIGKGCYLVEVQEPTDFTLRAERVTPSGLEVPDEMCHLGIGFDRMLDCFSYEGLTEEEARARCIVPSVVLTRDEVGECARLVGRGSTSCFEMNRFSFAVQGERLLVNDGDYRILYVLQGGGRLESGEGFFVSLKTGDQVFIPASSRDVRLSMVAESKVLEVRGPQL